jgi:hypothetical protein
MQNERIPAGLCQCGCGRQTNVAPRTDRTCGWIKGQPLRYVRGHGNGRPLSYAVRDTGFKTPCWIWQRYTNDEGYGTLGREGRMWSAHKYFYVKAKGPVPDGLYLDHLCRVPSCVNPDHLEPVTNAENCRRGAKAKLTEDDVRVIRQRTASGEKQRDIARDFGVTQACVSLIHTRQQWADVR